MNSEQWIFDLKQTVPEFLSKMRGENPGFFRYSFSGDLFGDSVHWGLGNTVFAIKSFYTLNLLNSMPASQKKEMADFVKSFQGKSNMLFDPLVKRRAFLRDKLSAIKYSRYHNFFHAHTLRAETRQAICALELLGERPDSYPEIPTTTQAIDKYLSALDWSSPWNAGSHFSHLVFFLRNSTLTNQGKLINHAIAWVNRIQDKDCGSWFEGQPSVGDKINGAMKVITGLQVADKMTFSHPTKLIDLALGSKDDRHACDNFNVVYVLSKANEITDGTYRNQEIQEFVRSKLANYREYYWPEYGGFSFLKGRANHYYYKAVITRGLPEPDMHGTVLFLWGITLISKILGWEKELGFQEYVT